MPGDCLVLNQIVARGGNQAVPPGILVSYHICLAVQTHANSSCLHQALLAGMLAVMTSYGLLLDVYFDQDLNMAAFDGLSTSRSLVAGTS